MTQIVVRLKHPVMKVRRDAVASLRRHNDGPGLDAAPDAADTKETAEMAHARCVARLTGAVERLVTQCQQWNQNFAARLRESQTLAVEIAIAVAEKLLHDQVGQGRHDVEKLVAAALAAGGSRKPTLLRLSPADEQRLKQSAAGGRLSQENAVQIAADPHLADGNVELDLPGYSLVFDWRHELEAMKRNILDDLGHADR